MPDAEEDKIINNNPISLASTVIHLKAYSEKSEAVLKAEIDKFMTSSEMIELSKKAEDSRLAFEMKKIRLAEVMIEQSVEQIRIKDGQVRIMLSGDKKTIKISLKQ